MRYLALALALSLTAAAASAHSPMNASTPASGAVLTAAPETIDMSFKHPVRLTKVTLTEAGAKAIEVDLSASKAFAESFSLPVSDPLSGAVAIEWRAIAQDGHAMKGVISFTVEKPRP